jgi:hypothetical protein
MASIPNEISVRADKTLSSDSLEDGQRRPLPEIGSNQTEKRGFVIPFPKFSPIKNNQHNGRDSEAQRGGHQQPRNIATNQEKDGHEKQTKTTP